MRWMGLGPARLLSLSDARKAAIKAQRLLLDGIDPIEARNKERRSEAMTFEDAAEQYITSQQQRWSNDKHRYQWRASLRDYAYPVLGDLPVDQITSDDVVRALQPIWTTKSETAKRVRGRIERVLDYARVAGHRDGENPARWKGELDLRLPPPTSVHKVKHHEAVPHAEAPALFARLGEYDRISAKALMFILLTAARTGEALNATWTEFDLDADIPVWTVPAERMKMRKTHRVPLSPPAVDLLRSLRPDGGDYATRLVFPGQISRKPVSDATLRKLLRKVGSDTATTHGLRSTFRDWVAECTDHPREIPEAALAHSIADEVEAAYLRTDQFRKRARLMREWSDFLVGE